MSIRQRGVGVTQVQHQIRRRIPRTRPVQAVLLRFVGHQCRITRSHLDGGVHVGVAGAPTTHHHSPDTRILQDVDDRLGTRTRHLQQ
ncbi:hypothetical protein, partial [Saccharothrix yanglingensis]|uniref:hypothetical protein n=1 Tax=Saccharothrix yanglingensis TaxID=659496 RepID=UPI0027D2E688